MFPEAESLKSYNKGAYSEFSGSYRKSSDSSSGIYSTQSESNVSTFSVNLWWKFNFNFLAHRPIHVPVYEKVPVNVPHPVPVAVPTYIRVPIPQPYPRYRKVHHKIEIPVYKLIPQIIEKPVPYKVERPYQVEVEKPFPVEVVKKLEIPVPKPYPVHVIYYKHISEDDPAPSTTPKPKIVAFKSQKTPTSFQSFFKLPTSEPFSSNQSPSFTNFNSDFHLTGGHFDNFNEFKRKRSTKKQ